MSETKKRWRPSLTAYRELQKQLSEVNVLLDEEKTTSEARLVEIDSLKRELSDAMSVCDSVSKKEYEKLKTEIISFKRSNELMDAELEIMRKKFGDMCQIADERSAEIGRLKSRGFFERLFNK